MGLKQSKVVKRSQERDTLVRKNKGTKFSTSSLGHSMSSGGGGSFLTVAPADEEDMDEDMDGRQAVVIPRRSMHIGGIFLDTLLITAPIDDPMDRDLGIFDLYNFDNPDEKIWAYIARPEVDVEDAKRSFAAYYTVLKDIQPNTNPNFPGYMLAGRIKRLIYAFKGNQQGEHDPEWRGRLVMIVALPSNGVFLSALQALSPTGHVYTWLALVVGLGLVRALDQLHLMGFVHRYVTPWNFLLLVPFSVQNIMERTHIIDLSLTCKWPTKKQQATPFVGTVKYSSKRALTRHNQGPADDYISVIFIVAEMISGKLPWRAIKDVDQCAVMKQKFVGSLQYKRLPRELRKLYTLLYRTYGLKKPEYTMVKGAFDEALERKCPDWQTRDLPDWLTMPMEM